ncbi:LLM class flavin-dependent oxidoreductase [Corynebacterium pacaense]|uniref:LLM class flavin-dependent oxidoreductase n=1 Tax=Corynebacterium pacaense TaxID=1816684 RepID=UPI0009BA65C2|nr:LLM class flavin-dependent oxidoreductase [Corynebacterium pacaense]
MSTFLIGVSLDPTPGIAASDIIPAQLSAAQKLDASGIDSLTFSDSLGNAAGRTEFDALTTAAFISTQTRQIGLVPTVTTTPTEPFHIATATATLDYTGRGRAAWAPVPSLTEVEARTIGRRHAAAPDAAWAETARVIEVVRALWDSWDQDAEIRDPRTSRFLDRDRVHVIDARITDSVGREYSVKGPSIVPRPPQGNPPVFITATDPEAVRAAARLADVIIVPVEPGGDVDGTLAPVHEAVDATGRRVPVLPGLSIPETADHDWFTTEVGGLFRTGSPGVHLRPTALGKNTDSLIAEIVDSAGAYGSHAAGITFRDRLGLRPVAANQFAG